MDDLQALHDAATPAPWTIGKGTKTVRDDTERKHAICRTHDPKWRYGDDAGEAADAALIVALRNAYADGSLIPRSEHEREIAEKDAVIDAARHYIDSKHEVWRTGYTMAMENEWFWLQELKSLLGYERDKDEGDSVAAAIQATKEGEGE